MKLTLPIGTFINMGTVTVGSLIGLFVQQLLTPELESIIFPSHRSSYFGDWNYDEP